MTSSALRRATLVATLTHWPCDLDTLPGDVTYLELRADLTGDVDPARLRRHFRGGLIYTLRSRAHGGTADDPPAARLDRLGAAARWFDLVDLEAPHDLLPSLLDTVPPARRRISWHGPAQPPAALTARFAAMAAVPAAAFLLVTAAQRAREALPPLRLLHRLGRRDVTAYGEGPAATWSRLLAPWLGAPWITGRITEPGDGDPDDGMPTVGRLRTDYGFPVLPVLHEVYGIIGAVARSTGFPRLHNREYRRCGRPSLFLPFYLPTSDAFRTGFWPEVPRGLSELNLPLRGLTVSGPLKEAALQVADDTGPAARSCGSANVMVERAGRWRAETTDASAITTVLRHAGVPTTDRPAAVIGCGGAGRAAAVALTSAGARVTVVNRGASRGRAAAELLHLPYAPLATFVPTGDAVVVNATPACATSPVPLDGLTRDAVVVDLVCAPQETALVSRARRHGLQVIDGWAVLQAEAEQQFRLMTGTAMAPADAHDATGRERGQDDDTDR